MDTIPQDTPLKQCSQPDCKQWFPLTTKFFRRNKTTKDGFYNQCRVCYNKKRRETESRPENRERRRAAMKVYQRSPERVAYTKAYMRAYYDRPRYREWKRERDKAYRDRPELREKRRVSGKAYRDRPEVRARRNANWHNRYVRKIAAPGTYTAQDIQAQFKRQKGKCYWCGDKLEKYHVDHIVPLSRGGSNWPDNLVVACPTCNIRKGTKLPHEFYEGGRLL